MWSQLWAPVGLEELIPFRLCCMDVPGTELTWKKQQLCAVGRSG